MFAFPHLWIFWIIIHCVTFTLSFNFEHLLLFVAIVPGNVCRNKIENKLAYLTQAK